jgi:glycosyltransferase involved in cell wall biosynthesis
MEGVSIVVCCYNSERRIIKVLEHLAAQKVEKSVNWEIIIVDNASTDKTAETAENYWTREDSSLRVVYEGKPGLSNARTTGLEEARYSVVSFIDDDNWVEDKWVQKIHSWFINDEKIGLLGGLSEAVIEGEKPFWFDKEQYSYAVGPQGHETGLHSKTMFGAGLSIRKRAWTDLQRNGFQFILADREGAVLTSGGDSELCMAVRLAGYDLYYDSNLKFYHQMPQGRLTWAYKIKLAQSFGRTDPVLNIYYSSINRLKGYKRYVRENRWMVVIYSIYLFMRSWPGYLKILFTKKEGRREDKIFHRTRFRMYESIRLFPYLPVIVSGIREAKWKKIQ